MEPCKSLKFVPFESVVDPSFWYKLCQIKLDVDKLEEKERSVWGSYMLTNSCSFHVDCTSFNKTYDPKLNSSEFTKTNWLCTNSTNLTSPVLRTQGTLINLNLLDIFKAYDKNKLIERFGKAIKQEIVSGEALKNPELINKFVLLTFVDLKSYEFYYWFAFPACSNVSVTFTEKPSKLQEVFSDGQIKSLLVSHSELEQNQQGVFGILVSKQELTCIPIKQYVEQINSGDGHEILLAFLDPSTEDEYPGWPLRNLLALVAHHSSCTSPIKLLCLRLGISFEKSIILTVKLEDLKQEKWVGWEKNLRGKFGPRYINLCNDMDHVKLAESSADLNLKLMKWRLVPELNLDVIQKQKCLLLGAGTLGCSVARSLMAWGVRHITFVDNGCVSFSNPIRQSLYTFEDCDLGDGPKLKATIAASALKKILPSMNSSGVILEIPMPGHPTGDVASANQLFDLIKSHDIVYLLTDSRESRWLPTLISTALNKIAVTAALGFDTYLVMRHGIEDSSGFKLGCYFCNDITAPGNSKIDRTLDQQCTVTRPGVSSIASSIAVDLTVSILQHSLGGRVRENEESLLGLIPHSIRGFLSSFSQVMPATPAFSQCIACSHKVIDNYNADREIFLRKVLECNTYLEDLTGLTELHKATEAANIWELDDDDCDDAERID